MRKLILIAAACLALSACGASTEPVNTASTAPPIAAPTQTAQATVAPALIEKARLEAQRAAYVAEAAYNVPAQAYVTLDGAGRLTPPIKATVKPVMLKLYEVLEKARELKRAADAALLLGDLVTANGFIATLIKQGDLTKAAAADASAALAKVH